MGTDAIAHHRKFHSRNCSIWMDPYFSTFFVITARKRSLRRLCFHRCLSVHSGEGVLRGRRDGHCRGRYVSCWNAFLFGIARRREQNDHHWFRHIEDNLPKSLDVRRISLLADSILVNLKPVVSKFCRLKRVYSHEAKVKMTLLQRETSILSVNIQTNFVSKWI